MNVIVTGGSRGIGKSIVERMANLNHNVIYTYKNKSCLCRDNVKGYQLDITDEESCLRFMTEIENTSFHPDVLINNVGVVKDVFFHKMEYRDWFDVINTNLISIFNITKPVFMKMREKGFGRIINISSVNAHKGQLGQANYCAAKAGILGFTKALALEGARYGVTVNSISPGYIETDMTKAIHSNILEKIISDIPIGRLGYATEIAHLVEFLSSKEASYISGADYAVNGAMYMS